MQLLCWTSAGMQTLKPSLSHGQCKGLTRLQESFAQLLHPRQAALVAPGAQREQQQQRAQRGGESTLRGSPGTQMPPLALLFGAHARQGRSCASHLGLVVQAAVQSGATTACTHQPQTRVASGAEPGPGLAAGSPLGVQGRSASNDHLPRFYFDKMEAATWAQGARNQEFRGQGIICALGGTLTVSLQSTEDDASWAAVCS